MHAVLEQNFERKLSVAAKSRSAKLLKNHRDVFVSANHETLPACKGLPCFLGGRSGFRLVWMLFLDEKLVMNSLDESCFLFLSWICTVI